MTARADEAERRLAAIELRLEGIDIFVADARRWLVDSLTAGERDRPLTTSEAAGARPTAQRSRAVSRVRCRGRDPSAIVRRPGERRSWPHSQPG